MWSKLFLHSLQWAPAASATAVEMTQAAVGFFWATSHIKKGGKDLKRFLQWSFFYILLYLSLRPQSNNIKPHSFESSVYQHDIHSPQALLKLMYQHPYTPRTFGQSLTVFPEFHFNYPGMITLSRGHFLPCVPHGSTMQYVRISLWIMRSKNAPCLPLLLETLSRWIMTDIRVPNVPCRTP